MEAIQSAILAEAHVMLRGKSYPVIIEAQGGDHLRVRLHSDPSASPPNMPEGTQLELKLVSQDKGFYAKTTLLKQVGDLLWLRIPAIWDSLERRSSQRRPGGFRVVYQVDEVEYCGECINIGVGGIMMRASQYWPPMTRLRLQFCLPLQPIPLHLQGLVIRTTHVLDLPDTVDLGIKFMNVTAEDMLRIARYVAL
jgi:hypothetical protein